MWLWLLRIVVDAEGQCFFKAYWVRIINGPWYIIGKKEGLPGHGFRDPVITVMVRVSELDASW